MAKPRGTNDVLSWLHASTPLDGRAVVDEHARYIERPIQAVLAGDCLEVNSASGVDYVVRAFVAHIPDELSIQTFVCLRCFTQLSLDERGVRHGDAVRCPVCNFTIEVQAAFFLSRMLMRSRESFFGEYSGYSDDGMYDDGMYDTDALYSDDTCQDTTR